MHAQQSHRKVIGSQQFTCHPLSVGENLIWQSIDTVPLAEISAPLLTLCPLWLQLQNTTAIFPLSLMAYFMYSRLSQNYSSRNPSTNPLMVLSIRSTFPAFCSTKESPWFNPSTTPPSHTHAHTQHTQHTHTLIRWIIRIHWFSLVNQLLLNDFCTYHRAGGGW